MIAALRGRLVRWHADAASLWVEVGGVTYEVMIPAYAAPWIAGHAEGAEVRVFTYEHATERQPVPTLYGFPTLVERDFFRKFIEVPDVGPTRAVRALARPISEIARWIEAGDDRALRQLPGIGERHAQTIVARLKGKVVPEALLRDQFDADGSPLAPAVDLRADVAAALLTLQYTEREADRLVADAMRARPELATVEEILREVLTGQASI